MNYMQKAKTPPPKGYDIELQLMVKLQFWRVWSTFSLLLLHSNLVW